MTFNLDDALKGLHPEQNIFLERGDLLAVKVK